MLGRLSFLYLKIKKKNTKSTSVFFHANDTIALKKGSVLSCPFFYLFFGQ